MEELNSIEQAAVAVLREYAAYISVRELPVSNHSTASDLVIRLPANDGQRQSVIEAAMVIAQKLGTEYRYMSRRDSFFLASIQPEATTPPDLAETAPSLVFSYQFNHVGTGSAQQPKGNEAAIFLAQQGVNFAGCEKFIGRQR